MGEKTQHNHDINEVYVLSTLRKIHFVFAVINLKMFYLFSFQKVLIHKLCTTYCF